MKGRPKTLYFSQLLNFKSNGQFKTFDISTLRRNLRNAYKIVAKGRPLFSFRMHNLRRISILLLLFSTGNLSGFNLKKLAINGNDFFSTTVLKELDENGITESPSPKPKVVKLNLKQGFVLNQIIEVYSLKGSSNELCTNHSKQFGLALRNLEAWALKSTLH